MKITPEIISHDKFHEGIWFLPVERPYWYYFMKGKSSNNIRNPDFLKSVDGPLKNLVSLLQSRGIKTTPSCAGHFRNEKGYVKTFVSLQKDEKEINGLGLRLRQVESGVIFIFRDKDYCLPFEKNEFIKKLGAIQQNGIIGIHLGNDPWMKKTMQMLSIDGVKLSWRKGILFIHTFEKNEIKNKQTWEKITTEIKNILPWIEHHQSPGMAPPKRGRAISQLPAGY